MCISKTCSAILLIYWSFGGLSAPWAHSYRLRLCELLRFHDRFYINSSAPPSSPRSFCHIAAAVVHFIEKWVGGPIRFHPLHDFNCMTLASSALYLTNWHAIRFTRLLIFQVWRWHQIVTTAVFFIMWINSSCLCRLNVYLIFIYFFDFYGNGYVGMDWDGMGIQPMGFYEKRLCRCRLEKCSIFTENLFIFSLRLFCFFVPLFSFTAKVKRNTQILTMQAMQGKRLFFYILALSRTWPTFLSS